MYSELDSLLPRSMRFAGIAPPRSVNLAVITCPLGRVLARYPRFSKRFMSGLYSSRILRLSAFGSGVFDNHHTYSTESLMRNRRTLTHSAGAGNLAGLYQKHSCAR